LKESIIKRQWNCKTTGFWTKLSIQDNFLLIMHEHLYVFRKPFEDEKKKENHLPSTIPFSFCMMTIRNDRDQRPGRTLIDKGKVLYCQNIIIFI